MKLNLQAFKALEMPHKNEISKGQIADLYANDVPRYLKDTKDDRKIQKFIAQARDIIEENKGLLPNFTALVSHFPDLQIFKATYNSAEKLAKINEMKKTMEYISVAVIGKADSSLVAYRDYEFACGEGTLTNLQKILMEMTLKQSLVDIVAAAKSEMMDQIVLEGLESLKQTAATQNVGGHDYLVDTEGFNLILTKENEVHNVASLRNLISDLYNLKYTSKAEDKYVQEYTASSELHKLKAIVTRGAWDTLEKDDKAEIFIASIVGKVQGAFPESLPLVDVDKFNENIAIEGLNLQAEMFYDFNSDKGVWSLKPGAESILSAVVTKAVAELGVVEESQVVFRHNGRLDSSVPSELYSFIRVPGGFVGHNKLSDKFKYLVHLCDKFEDNLIKKQDLYQKYLNEFASSSWQWLEVQTNKILDTQQGQEAQARIKKFTSIKDSLADNANLKECFAEISEQLSIKRSRFAEDATEAEMKSGMQQTIYMIKAGAGQYQGTIAKITDPEERLILNKALDILSADPIQNERNIANIFDEALSISRQETLTKKLLLPALDSLEIALKAQILHQSLTKRKEQLKSHNVQISEIVFQEARREINGQERAGNVKMNVKDILYMTYIEFQTVFGYALEHGICDLRKLLSYYCHFNLARDQATQIYDFLQVLETQINENQFVAILKIAKSERGTKAFADFAKVYESKAVNPRKFLEVFVDLYEANLHEAALNNFIKSCLKFKIEPDYKQLRVFLERTELTDQMINQMDTVLANCDIEFRTLLYALYAIQPDDERIFKCMNCLQQLGEQDNIDFIDILHAAAEHNPGEVQLKCAAEICMLYGYDDYDNMVKVISENGAELIQYLQAEETITVYKNGKGGIEAFENLIVKYQEKVKSVKEGDSNRKRVRQDDNQEEKSFVSDLKKSRSDVSAEKKVGK
jgi:hypothetical protein